MQLVNVNTDMSRLIERARAAAAAAAAGEDNPNARQNRIANMSLSLRLWLELQSAVNGLLDSTTVDRRSAATPPVSHPFHSPLDWQNLVWHRPQILS